jgi:hypothetical protein
LRFAFAGSSEINYFIVIIRRPARARRALRSRSGASAELLRGSEGRKIAPKFDATPKAAYVVVNAGQYWNSRRRVSRPTVTSQNSIIMRDVIIRIADHPIKRIGELLPWNWAAAQLARPASSVGRLRCDL